MSPLAEAAEAEAAALSACEEERAAMLKMMVWWCRLKPIHTHVDSA
jgi:hypothetical protein